MKPKSDDFYLKVKVTKEFSVQPEKVFDAWLDPSLLSKWMFGPDVREEEIISLTNNPKPGGAFSYVVRRSGKDLDHQGTYSEELDHRGTYREIDRPSRLVFTWGVNKEAGDESVVTIEIESSDDGCRLTLIHELDPKWEEYADRTRQGWGFMLDKLQETITH